MSLNYHKLLRIKITIILRELGLVSITKYVLIYSKKYSKLNSHIARPFPQFLNMLSYMFNKKPKRVEFPIDYGSNLLSYKFYLLMNHHH